MLTSPRNISLFISILVAIVTGIFSALMFFINSSDIWKYLLVEILAIFIIAYVITFYTIRKILINKITPIYKIIQQTGNSNLNNIDSFDNKNLIEEASKDVTNWFKLKTREIEKLKKLEKYRREFLGNVSHELKTPIFNAQGYISTLIDGGIDDKNINKKLSQKTQQRNKQLITNGKRLRVNSELQTG